MYVDPTGHSFLAILIVAAIAGAIIGAAAAGVEAYKAGGDGLDIAGAAILGGIAGAAVGAISAAIGGVGASMIGSGAAAIGAGLSGAAGVGALSMGGAQVLGGSLLVGGVIGLNVWFATTENRGGYYGQKYSDDHAPEHIHLKGTDGSDIKLGKDLKPIKGQGKLTPQQRKAIKKLWQQLLDLFNGR